MPEAPGEWSAPSAVAVARALWFCEARFGLSR